MYPRARLIIPALLLVATITSGAYAAFTVLTLQSSVTVHEDTSGTTTQQFSPGDIFPGESSLWTFTVSNNKTSGSQPIQIVFQPMTGGSNGLRSGITYNVTITGNGTPTCSPAGAMTNAGTSASATCSNIDVPSSGTITVKVRVMAASDAAPSFPDAITIKATIQRV